jgi:putative transcriptional regulator
MDKRTMREFDELCLTPVRPLRPKEIRLRQDRRYYADPGVGRGQGA